MSPARLLVAALMRPAAAAALDDAGWERLLTAARAESLLGSLACRLETVRVPPAIDAILANVRADMVRARVQALWEAEMARRAFAGAGLDLILLKGTAYAAAGLPAGDGRSIGDLDILVPRERLDEPEAALLAAGWEWVKPDAYDDDYYRRWMHELPPLIHKSRDRMIDVHHTILPPTAKPNPDAAALIAARIALPNGMQVLSPPDMIVHAAAHLFADGDLAGGLRNLWDIDRLLRAFTREADFWPALKRRAALHGLTAAVARALRLAALLYGTPVDPALAGPKRLTDRLFVARLLARDGWGRERRPLLRLAFYIRSHWLRMPPLLLARHLWVKATRSSAGTSSA